MVQLLACNKRSANSTTFLLYLCCWCWLVCQYSVLSFDVIEKCEEGCRNKVIANDNVFDIACNDTCKLYQCRIGCQRWTYSLNSCQHACNDSSNVNSWVLYCVLGCNHALSVYIDKISGEVGIPSSPWLVADSLTNESLAIEWNAAPYANITYLVQWKYASSGDWNYYKPDVPLSASHADINGLYAYTRYRFRVAWILLPQLPPLLSKQSAIISTLPYGVPSSPSITSVLAVSSTQISVSWEPPRFPNGPILSYTLYLNEFSNYGTTVVKDFPNSYIDSDMNYIRGNNKSHNAMLHYMFNGLKTNTKYRVRVLTRNNFGEGPTHEKTVITLSSESGKEFEHKTSLPSLVLATDKEVILARDPELFPIFGGEVIFRLNDYTTTGEISGLAVHVEYMYIFVSDTTGSVRRISLKDENNKKTKAILKDRSRKPSHLSVDWLFDKLYMVEETKISRCNLDGEHMISVIPGLKSRPRDIKVDPYNGYLYWLLDSDYNSGLYRVDLSHIDDNLRALEYTERIYTEPSLTTFAVDYANYLIYLPISREKSIFSITIDCNDPTNIRYNSQRDDQLEDIENLVVHDKLFYFTKDTEVYREEYEKESEKYHHNSIQISNANSLISLRVMDNKSQPIPVPLNPVRNIEAVFLDRSAKIVWQKPDLLGGSGHGAWQKWSYEVCIEESYTNITYLVRGLTLTNCEADDLRADTEYYIKVRGYSEAGNGSWSESFRGKTLKKIDRNSRFPFAIWSTREGVLKSNIVGERVEHLVHKMNMNDSIVNDISWYRDGIFLNANNNIYVYNETTHSGVVKLNNITTASSISIDWLAPKLYWSSPVQHMISRSNLDGTQSEPLPIETLANEIAIDAVSGYLYWETGYTVEFCRLNGMSRANYFHTGLFSGKHIMGLTLNVDDNLVFWIVRSDEKATLYSAQTVTSDNADTVQQTVVSIGQLKESYIRGPLVYFSDRMFWLQEQRNEALISDTNGQNLALLKGSGLLDINTLAIVDPSLQPLPHGFETYDDVSVIPNNVNESDIKVLGTWDNFTIVWSPVTNVNFGRVYYDIVLEVRHDRRTAITKQTSYLYVSSIQLPPYSKVKLAIRAFTHWASSKQTIVEIYTPMSIPTKPTVPRVYVYYERSIFYNTVEKINAEFRWNAPELPNGKISGYTVNAWTLQSDQKNIEVLNEKVIGNSNNIYLSDLKCNTSYFFQVQAATDAGEGPSSDVVEAVSADEHPVPRLLVATTDSIRVMDVDSKEEKVLPLKPSYPLAVAYSSKEDKVFWIEEDGDIKWAHMDGSNVTIISRVSFPGNCGLTVDWISRHLYWSENSYKSSQTAIIWSYDYNNPNAKPVQIVSKAGVTIGSIEIDPFSSKLIWTEMFVTGQGLIKYCEVNANPTNGQLFFQTNKLLNKSAINDNCNCVAHASVRDAIAIDRSNQTNHYLLWFDAKHNRIMASDLSGCRCRVVLNSIHSFPPTSLSADNDFIYWSNATLGNVYKVSKQLINKEPESRSLREQHYSYHYSLHSDVLPHFVLSQSPHSIRDIRSFGDHLQPYPDYECLLPMEYNKTVKLVDNTAYSLLIAIPTVNRPQHCSKISIASILYTIYYGKVLSGGSQECGVSLRGCKKHETYNNTVTINRLEPFTNYTIKVAVKNYYSPKDQYNLPAAEETVLETAEAKPTPPRNVIAKVETPRKIVITWEPPEKPNGDPIRYEVRWFTSKDTNGHKAIYAKKPNTTQFGDRFTMTLNGIEPSLTYSILVRAYSSDNVYHIDSDTVSVTTYSLPNHIMLEKRSSRTITVSWLSPPSSTNVSEIAQHTMQFCPMGEQRWNSHPSRPAPTRPSLAYDFTFTNLLPNTDYSFRLLLTYRSTSALFEWPKTNRYIFKTLGEAPQAPNAPLVEDVTQHVYKVWWHTVNPNGAHTVFYNLMIKEYVSDEESMYSNRNKWLSVYNDTLNYWIMDDISMDKEYVFRVQAISEFGASNHSNQSDPFYFPNKEVIIDTETSVITIVFIILGSFLLVMVAIILCVTVYKRQDQVKKQSPADAANGTLAGVEIWPLSELPAHHHQTNTLYTNSLDLDEELTGVTKIPHQQIKVTGFLGSGAFGEVHEGVWKCPHLTATLDTRVAIKNLSKDTTEQKKIDFIKEAKVMANFKHPHILHFLGITDRNSIILELMEAGDLLQFLRDNRPRDDSPSYLTMDDLLSICVDVAKGCKYLEDIHFIHRDLAARNCLVSSYDRARRVVKIGDFGLARDIYKNDYYRKDGEVLLPVRWMAPESLVDGQWTIQSDVWSFGVLLYEVMSIGQQPYQARSNLEVCSYVRTGGTLDKPLNCPEKMFKLMKSCWTYDPAYRPSFSICLQVLENIRETMSNSPTLILSVHNQNYISRGIDNPGYSEDERQAGNSQKLKRMSNSSRHSTQTCTTTNDGYQNSHLKFLDFIGSEEEEITDADGYQIPIGKSPLQTASDKNQLLNTVNRIVLNCSSKDYQRVSSPVSSAVSRRHSSRNCSPPPNYYQIFKVNDNVVLNNDSNSNNYSRNNINYNNSNSGSKKPKILIMDDNSSQNGRLCLSRETKNNNNSILVCDDSHNHNNVSQSLQMHRNSVSSQSSPLSSPLASPSFSTATDDTANSNANFNSSSPTIAAALLKAHSQLSIIAPSRTMTEIKYCFERSSGSVGGDQSKSKLKTCDSLQSSSDSNRSSNNCSTEEEEDYEEFDTSTIAANELFCAPEQQQTIADNSLAETIGYANSAYAQSNGNQSKYAIIAQISGKTPYKLTVDTNSSWC